MNVILTTWDGTERTATIQSLRAFPLLLELGENLKPHRFFVRTGDNLDNHYAETIVEQILNLEPEKPSDES